MATQLTHVSFTNNKAARTEKIGQSDYISMDKVTRENYTFMLPVGMDVIGKTYEEVSSINAKSESDYNTERANNRINPAIG